MSEIVTLNNGLYSYSLPRIPRDRDILYYDLKKSDQYWRSAADTRKQLDIKNIKKMP
ncbi:MAG: hypothetical protein NVS1B13_20950 [Flavisolibacter sp.]